MKVTMVLAILAALVMACSGSTKGKVKSAGSVQYSGQEDSSSDGEPGAWPAGEGIAPAPAGADGHTYGSSDRPELPPECQGRVPDGRTVGSNITSCVCESGGWRSTWGTYRWDGSFPNCKIPYPDQVVRGAIGDPNEANPYDERAESATDSRARITRGDKSTQVRCATRIQEQQSVAVCQIQRGDDDPVSYSCVGSSVQALTAAEQAAYTGGPPCTCETGNPTKLGAPENTWQCK